MTRKPVTRTLKTTRRTRTPARSARVKTPDTLETLIAANAQALALPVDPAWKPGVTLNLRSLFVHAALVDEFILPDDTEPAPVFRA
jgi:hypothetical protein